VRGGLDLGLDSTEEDKPVTVSVFLSFLFPRSVSFTALHSLSALHQHQLLCSFFAMAKFKVHELRTRSKTELLNQVSDSIRAFSSAVFWGNICIFLEWL
jgi:hypothetical protein